VVATYAEYNSAVWRYFYISHACRFCHLTCCARDPFSRRFTWDVIRSYRQDRIIILTTHFMDEADILGDRIAILAEGQLRCMGSSLWLKKQYSVGYQLTIERLGSRQSPNEAGGVQLETDDDSGSEASATFQSANLKQIVTTAVPKATIITDVGGELSYRLPISESSKFPSMFELLDAEVGSGEISSYGVSITTLNAVFVAVTRGETAASRKDLSSSRRLESSRKLSPSNTEIQDSDETSAAFPDSPATPSGCAKPAELAPISREAVIDLENDTLFFRHMGSLLKKRALYFKRDKKAWICTTFVPSFFVLIGLIVFVVVAVDRNLPPLKLNFNDYNPSLGNFITFNSPTNPFLCQPGICSHRQPYVDNPLTEERYVFCGYESRLGIKPRIDGVFELTNTNQNCTISHSRDIIDTAAVGDVELDEAGVRSIYEASQYLDLFQNSYAASKYGAIWFTHDQLSSLDDGRSYDEAVIEQCRFISPQLTYKRDCERYGGIGYVIQYNFTALHASVMYENIANEALVRHGTGNPNFKVETTIAPLPLTNTEESIGAGEDAFAVWFLVSPNRCCEIFSPFAAA